MHYRDFRILVARVSLARPLRAAQRPAQPDETPHTTQPGGVGRRAIKRLLGGAGRDGGKAVTA